MAQINNPRKQFQFNIIIAGINPFLCQEVKSPDVDYDVVEHGDTNFDVKTAGKKKVGMISLTKIFSNEDTNNEVRAWGNSIQSSRTGGGLLPSQYKRSVMIEQYAADGVTVLERWEYEGCWPSKINGIEFSRKSSENTVQTMELCVDEEN